MGVAKRTLWTAVSVCALLASLATPLQAAGIAEVCKAIGIKEKDAMFSSVLTGRVLEGNSKQIVAVTTFFTGSKGRDDAVNVRLDVFNERGGKLVPVFSRDYGKEYAGYVGRGDLELVDLDTDGINDIIVTFDRQDNPLVEQRLGEVILLGSAGFEVGWKGIMMLDATRDARSVPLERRDHFRREVDIPRTLKSRGATLFLKKKMIAVAGERLEKAKELTETFPLRSAMK
jgi:hypothetical protein